MHTHHFVYPRIEPDCLGSFSVGPQPLALLMLRNWVEQAATQHTTLILS